MVQPPHAPTNETLLFLSLHRCLITLHTHHSFWASKAEIFFLVQFLHFVAFFGPGICGVNGPFLGDGSFWRSSDVRMGGGGVFPFVNLGPLCFSFLTTLSMVVCWFRDFQLLPRRQVGVSLTLLVTQTHKFPLSTSLLFSLVLQSLIGVMAFALVLFSGGFSFNDTYLTPSA